MDKYGNFQRYKGSGEASTKDIDQGSDLKCMNCIQNKSRQDYDPK